MPDVLTRKGARNFTETVDRVASAVQTKHGLLGIPQDVASDFALRCDLIADAVELRAAANEPLTEIDDDPESKDQNKPETYESGDKSAKDGEEDDESPDDKTGKKAAPEWPLQPGKDETGDSVEPAGSADPHWNANAVGDQRPGPFKSEPDEAFMAGEFTQQEFQELRDKQQAGQLPGVDAKLASEFMRLSYEIDKSAGREPEILQGFAGFTGHIRRLGEIGTELEQNKAQIEAIAGDLLRKKKDLDKEYDAAVKKLKDAVPKEIEAQGRIVMERKTALVQATAIMQVKRNPRTMNQVEAEMLRAVAEQYGDEVAAFIKVTTKTLRDQNKKMSVLVEGFSLEDRTLSASTDKEAGLLDALTRFREWIVKGFGKMISFFSTATRIISGAGKNCEKAHDQFLKQARAFEKAASDDEGFNFTE